MEAVATSKYIRVSPRKLTLLVKSLKSLTPSAAAATLEFIHKSGAEPLRETILAAIANAKNRNVGSIDQLVFKSIEVQPGSGMRRFRAVSRGMAHEYKKRMSHIKVVLAEKPIQEEKQKPEIKKEAEKASV